jgi:hypothetical protein
MHLLLFAHHFAKNLIEMLFKMQICICPMLLFRQLEQCLAFTLLL